MPRLCYVSVFAPLAALALSACSATLPVTGQAGDGSETFTGKATGYIDGGGTISIVSNKGRQCDGTFVYISDRHGSGTFNCNDNTSGSFDFVSTGTRGTGSGTLAGKPFTFTFG